MTKPDYATYGGVRPTIPDWAVEVGYRTTKIGDVFLGVDGQIYCHGVDDDADDGQPRIILARKPDDLDPRLVAPEGYEFLLDAYGRPVCRAPICEWGIGFDGKLAYFSGEYPWFKTAYILEKIEPEPKPMTIIEAAKGALNLIIRRRSNHIKEIVFRQGKALFTDVEYTDFDATDWEVVP